MNVCLRLLFLLLVSISIYANSPDVSNEVLGSKANPIKVGVLTVSPFGEKKGEDYFGLSIEYWKEIASIYGWNYKFYPAGQNYKAAVIDAKDGIYDVLLGNFSTYYERGKIVDFSRPFLLNYVSVLTSTRNSDGLLDTFIKVSIRIVLPIIFSAVIFLFLFSILVSRNSDLSKEKGFLVNVFYVAISILQGQITYIHKPSCNISRIIIITIAIFALIFASSFTAIMTDTVFILEKPIDPFTKIKDVAGKKFVLEQGSGFVDIVKSVGGITIEVPGADESLDYYYKNKEKFDGYVADHALIHMYDKNIPDHDIIQSQINLRNDELVFIFNKDFAYSDKVNLGILKLQDNNTSKLICARYLGVDSKLCLI